MTTMNYNPFTRNRERAFSDEAQLLYEALSDWRVMLDNRYLSGDNHTKHGFSRTGWDWYTKASKRHWKECAYQSWNDGPNRY